MCGHELLQERVLQRRQRRRQLGQGLRGGVAAQDLVLVLHGAHALHQLLDLLLEDLHLLPHRVHQVRLDQVLQPTQTDTTELATSSNACPLPTSACGGQTTKPISLLLKCNTIA